MLRTSAAVASLVSLLTCCLAQPGLAADKPFDRVASKMDGPMVEPWRTLRPDKAYHGQWLVAGDLDGDNVAEIVTVRNDSQVVTAMIATKLDGSTLWTWGTPNGGKQGLGYDVPVQIYDHDGDGRNEVWLSPQGCLLVLDGKTGKELKRLPLPKGLRVADCIVFADLRGTGRVRDIIIKDRYRQIWAYSPDWKPMWHWAAKGYMTCHHPTPVDLNGDGKDEVVAGYTALDPKGKELWTIATDKINLKRGHLDCCEVMTVGKRPEECRLVLTCCGANGVAMVDGRGKVLWEVTGYHFESADVAKVCADAPGKQVVVDVDHQPYGKSPVWLLDAKGRRIGSWMTDYGRHHRIVDWDGDGLDEVLLAHSRRLVDGKGKCTARFGPKGAFDGESREMRSNDPAPFGLVGDLDGDGRSEVILHSVSTIHIYRSERSAKVRNAPLGTGVNVTLY